MSQALPLYRALRTSAPRAIQLRCFSSAGSLKKDPSKFVHGVTKEKMESNPAIAEFVSANFPEAFEDAESSNEETPEGIMDGSIEGDESLSNESSYFARKAERAEPDYPLNIRPLSTYMRDDANEEGSRRSRELRWQGMIPGVVYGGDPNLGIFAHQPESKIFVKTPWQVLQRELDRYHRSFESRVYDLTILEGPDDTEGVVHRVIPQNVQRHPVQTAIFCANFCRYHAARPIKIPIVQINEEESPALKRDGYIVPIKRFVECLVEEGASIPERLELECTGLQSRNVIRLDRILLPDGVRVSDRVRKIGDEYIIGVVFGRGKGSDDDDDEDATAAAPKA
jgi:ribosomal protein L25 (general stress protein Ctc)